MEGGEAVRTMAGGRGITNSGPRAQGSPIVYGGAPTTERPKARLGGERALARARKARVAGDEAISGAREQAMRASCAVLRGCGEGPPVAGRPEILAPGSGCGRRLLSPPADAEALCRPWASR